ncbi:TonB-dependent receptor family protein [Ferrimonas senticii]|uniref:TonB-dependent receptor family protein n=1 Tax=Ferrimonas senticii TaxID=394566 RepID=UPI00047F7DD7|nr:TonB-dependent receptor [Ferrimonas senticii]
MASNALNQQGSMLGFGGLLFCAASALADDTQTDRYLETIQILGQQDSLRTEAGSTTVIDELQLQKFSFDDIERILATVPGINIRSEDGYGLRPNIGFRGVTPERSKKITLMEDGVLIAPAPYSASAAYYFPMMAKMTAVEVFKGPAAIKYGPYTVAGALNLVSRSVPDSLAAMADIAGGSDGYLKGHGYVGDRFDNGIGVLLEGVHVESDGYKQLDGGGDTGFSKNEVMAKLRYDWQGDKVNQLLELKLVYADEDSDETYLGLTDSDFAAQPNRRYVASSLDNMNWEHSQFQLTHFIEGEGFDVSTKAYRNDLSRAWFKLNGFVDGPDLSSLLQNPNQGVNDAFYQVLIGAADSSAINGADNLLIGTNDRDYFSQGLQSDWRWQLPLWGFEHNLHGGVRFHQDQIERNHTEDAFAMQSGVLLRTTDPRATTTLNREKTSAWSLYLQDTLSWDKLDITVGVRGEFLDMEYQNRQPGKEGDYLDKTTNVWLPGISTFYRVSDNLGVFAGVHEGFVPTSPAQDPRIESESSINYELGSRFNNGTSKVEAVLFFNDFDNLKESCSFSQGASCLDNLDAEFNGGEVDVYGLELAAEHLARWGDFELPLSLSYSYLDSEFQTSFDSDFSLWGQVSAGDQLPYLPEHQLTLGVGITAAKWSVDLQGRYLSAMKEAAGTGVTLSGVETDALWTLDLAAAYDFGGYGKLYGKVDNLLDEQQIVSRRPYGARPNRPQQFILGYRLSY